MVSIQLTREHGYVMAVGLGSCILMTWLGFKVGAARKQAQVAYPNMYASKEEAETDKLKLIFNCTQRGHQNTVENYPAFLVLLLLSAVEFPLYSAICGSLWIVGRVLYMNGYSTGDPKKRYRGAIQYLGLIGMLGMAAKTAFSLITKA